MLEGDERKKAVELKGLHVDIGVRDGEEARQLVREGDPIVVAADPLELRDDRLVSRALDNRLGVYVALEVARRVKEAGGGTGPVAAVAATMEEIGSHGARAMAFGLEPDLCIAVDVTHATDAPGVDAGELGEHGLGSGPVITRGAVVSRPLNDLLDAAAESGGHRVLDRGRPARRPAPTRTPSTSSRTGVPTPSSRSRCATCTRRSSWSSWATWRRRSR